MLSPFTDEIFEEIRNKLMDPNFVNRYGTSAAINMSRDYKKYLSENFERLKDEFDKINKQPEDGITKKELSDFLEANKKNKDLKITQNYIDKIFNIMDMNKDSQITM
jgi:hypothetical protein